MKFFLCCGSGARQRQQQPPEESRLLVVPQARPIIGRKRGRERRCRVLDWRPSLSSILEDNVLPERNQLQPPPPQSLRRKGGGASISARDRAHSSHQNGVSVPVAIARGLSFLPNLSNRIAAYKNAGISAACHLWMFSPGVRDSGDLTGVQVEWGPKIHSLTLSTVVSCLYFTGIGGF
ncbi:unnamed protein product [Fraxinus pennsylvanica]|uniref:Uncharacterized protein n=1 Tax=Fraxinus pennsylvanica TaxID=56036 RepID=A0AAD2AFL4_9LAMI|nr:unnamed protein product [Fraxinus pennsylvanica]